MTVYGMLFTVHVSLERAMPSPDGLQTILSILIQKPAGPQSTKPLHHLSLSFPRPIPSSRWGVKPA